MGEPQTLREALDRDLIGMIRTSWPMDRSAEEKGWNEAVHACREKVRAALTERPRLVASPDSLRLDPEDPVSVAMPLDLVDALHETAASIHLDLVAHFDRDHTKAETYDAMLGIGLRLSKWAHAVWALAHHIEGGRNTPPTRYMRHMAAGAPPPSADDVVAAALRDLPAREWKASALPDPEVTK